MDNQSTVTEFRLLGLSSFPEMQPLLFMSFLIIYLLTLAGNFSICLAIWADTTIHTPMYFFLVNLSVLDISYSSVTLPNMLMMLFAKIKSLSFSNCMAQLYFLISFGGSESFLLALMAYDRYMAICQPLHYATIMNHRTCMCSAIAIWTGGFVYSVLDTFFIARLPFCGPNEINHFLCEILPLIKLACMDTYFNEMLVFLLIGAVGGSCFLLISTSYAYILFTIMKIRSAQGRRKAFSTCASHLLIILLFYGPGFFTHLHPYSSYSIDIEKVVSVFYTMVTPMLNPMIYSLRNKDVQAAFKKAMGRARK
ncbi:olfactory receptor 1019-like [Gopherus flavomarginatus]|uniref:olfactory receptor 1019-like n=1 Tax=Gopherus flavomarginatus TaxID=286002 RepID=UPI0021CBA93E|nr:olfactory receptor 1019-like [Gopherus flavomarginatus]